MRNKRQGEQRENNSTSAVKTVNCWSATDRPSTAVANANVNITECWTLRHQNTQSSSMPTSSSLSVNVSTTESSTTTAIGKSHTLDANDTYLLLAVCFLLTSWWHQTAGVNPFHQESSSGWR